MSVAKDNLSSLAIILVLYKSYDDVETFLSVQQPAREKLLFIVVDNTPHAVVNHAALARIASRRNVTVIIAEPENLGYSGAAHFALTRIPELREFDYVALSNTDLLYKAVEMQAILSETSDQHTNVGIIAPRLTHLNGTPKGQLHYISKPRRTHYARLARIFSNYPLAIAHRLASDLKRNLRFSRDNSKTPRFLFAPHGALVVVTRAYIHKTAGFDHPAFLFCEEIFFGAECERAGLDCIFEPKLVYSHEHHGAMGSVPSRRVIAHLRDAHRAVLPFLD